MARVYPFPGMPSLSLGDLMGTSGITWLSGFHPQVRDSLEKGMTNHPSILAWRITWTEESSRLQ